MNIFLKNKKFDSQKGFTLIETLLAISIFASSITALMVISAKGINDNVFVKNKLTASYLALEGVEMVRNARDTRALTASAGQYWSEFITSDVGSCYRSSSSAINSCYVDASEVSPTFSACDEDGVCPNLKYDNDLNMYTYSGIIQDSIFNRTIYIESVSSAQNEVIVKSIVTWEQGRNTFTTTYQYNLFDWING